MPVDNMPTLCNKLDVMVPFGPAQTIEFNQCVSIQFGHTGQPDLINAETSAAKYSPYSKATSTITTLAAVIGYVASMMSTRDNWNGDDQQSLQLWALRTFITQDLQMDILQKKSSNIPVQWMNPKGKFKNPIELWDDDAITKAPTLPMPSSKLKLILSIALESTAIIMDLVATVIDNMEVDQEATLAVKTREAGTFCKYMTNNPAYALIGCNPNWLGLGQWNVGSRCFINLFGNASQYVTGAKDNKWMYVIGGGVPYTTTNEGPMDIYNVIGQYTRNLLGALTAADPGAWGDQSTIWGAACRGDRMNSCNKTGTLGSNDATVIKSPIINNLQKPMVGDTATFTGVELTFNTKLVGGCTFNLVAGNITSINTLRCAHGKTIDYYLTPDWAQENKTFVKETWDGCRDPEPEQYKLAISCNPYMIETSNEFVLKGIAEILGSSYELPTLIIPLGLNMTVDDACITN